MKSEKVKEIKESLQQEIHLTEYVDMAYSENVRLDLLKDVLTLINELESENERLRKCREVDYKTMTALRQANTELNECMDEMQDRIAELEKEIEENAFYSKGYADGIKNTYEVVVPDKLKRFAEMLIDKKIKLGERFNIYDIDETLKEFIND